MTTKALKLRNGGKIFFTVEKTHGWAFYFEFGVLANSNSLELKLPFCTFSTFSGESLRYVDLVFTPLFWCIHLSYEGELGKGGSDVRD